MTSSVSSNLSKKSSNAENENQTKLTEVSDHEELQVEDEPTEGTPKANNSSSSSKSSLKPLVMPPSEIPTPEDEELSIVSPYAEPAEAVIQPDVITAPGSEVIEKKSSASSSKATQPPESLVVADPESQPPVVEPEPEPPVVTDPEPELEPPVVADPEPELEPPVVADPEPELEPPVVTDPEPEPEPSVVADPEPEPETEPQQPEPLPKRKIKKSPSPPHSKNKNKPVKSSNNSSESEEENFPTKNQQASPYPTTIKDIVLSRESGGRCQDCGKNIADVRCDDCSLLLCSSCSSVIHSRNAFRRHNPISLTSAKNSTPRNICNYCQSKPSVAMCLECDSNSTMCVPCWFHVHRDNRMAVHKPKLLLWPCDNCFIERQLKGEGRAPPALWFCPSCSLRLCRNCWRDVHRVDGDLSFHYPTDIYSKDNSPVLLESSKRHATQVYYSKLSTPLQQSDLSINQNTKELNRLGFDPVVRYRLLNYITLMCPHKLPSVVPTLCLFAGRTSELFERLISRYGPEPTYDCLRLPLPYGWRLVQSAYGDVFYLHNSGEKQWNRPGLHKASEAANLLVTVGHHGLVHNELK